MALRRSGCFFLLAAAIGCESQIDTSTGVTNGAGPSSGAGATSSSNGSGASVSSSSTSGPGPGGSSSGGAPSGEVRLIAIGDTGEGNTAQHCVADAMNAKCGQDGCNAVLLNGDNFYDVGVSGVDDGQWLDKFEEPYDRQHLNGLKFYAVLGNHDYAPPPFDIVTPTSGEKQAQIDYSFLPVGSGPGMRYSDKWLMPDGYYDVPLGNGIVHLFAVDSQDTSDTQLNDMQGRVAASTAVWKLAFAHHPRYTSGDHQLDNDFLDTISGFDGPSMYELQQAVYCNVDIYMSGHDHNREYIDKGQDPQCPNTSFLISGAGSKIRASGGNKLSNSVYYDEAIEGFVYFVFTGTQLTIESYDSNPADCAGAGLAAPAWSTTLTK